MNSPSPISPISPISIPGQQGTSRYGMSGISIDTGHHTYPENQT